MNLSNPSLAGKVCMVTGATAGIGWVTARALAQQGATVIVVGRDAAKCESTVEQIRQHSANPSVTFLVADLSSQKEIRQLATQFINQQQRLDVLVNNAGGAFVTRQESVDGIEMTLALNHLNYFLLTHLLLNMLVASDQARVINVSSSEHQKGSMHFDDLNGRKRYNGLQAYRQSKLANVLFNYELARRLSGTRVTVNALNPGLVATNLWTNNGIRGKLIRRLLNLASQNAEKGAQTSIHLAVSPEVEGVTGKYFENKQPVASSPASYDEAAASRLWRVSEERAGLQ